MILRGFLLIVILVSAGCTSRLGPKEGDSALHAGDARSYVVKFSNASHFIGSFNTSIVIGPVASRSYLMGGNAQVIPVTFLVPTALSSTTFVADYSREGLVHLESRGPTGDGSEQFWATTSNWAGYPDGPLTPERCLAGVLLPIILARAGDAAQVPLGTNASWSADTGAIRSSTLLGNASLTPQPLPDEAIWNRTDGRTCELVATSNTSTGENGVPWPPSPGYSPTKVSKIRMLGRLPPASALPIAIQLHDADERVAASPTGAVFFRNHPDAWLVRAEFQDSAKAWQLIYGSSDSNEMKWFTVTQVAAGVAVARDTGDYPHTWTPARGTRELVPADDILGRLTRRGPLSEVGWYAEATQAEVGTDDAGTWQFRWESPSFDNFVVSASSGLPLDHSYASASPVP